MTLWGLALALMGSTGCVAPPLAARPQLPQEGNLPSDNELRERLSEFVEFVQSSVEAAGAEIERQSPDRESRQAAALWRIRITEETRNALNQDDAREALIDLWTLCARVRDYLSKGEGKAMFGAAQAPAVDGAEKILAAFEKIAQDFVPAASLDGLRQKVAAYSQAHPIHGRWEMASNDQLSDHPEINNQLGTLVALPLAPLKAMAAVGRTPGSIHDAAMAVRRFSDVVADFPASARWQLQLLSMSLDESATVLSGMNSFKTLSESSTRLADNSARFVQVLESLPEKTRKEAETLLKTVDSMDGMDHTVANAGQAATAIAHAAQAVTEAAREISKLVPTTKKDAAGQIVGAAVPASARATPATTCPNQDATFSFQAVTQSAVELGATSDKLRLLVADVQQLTRSDAVDTTTSRLQALIDHATKRLTELLLATFSLALVYRLVTARLRSSTHIKNATTGR